MFDRGGKLSYYQILGVPRECAPEQIEGACWHLWHRYSSKSSVALWREVKGQIDEIHDTLLDPRSRAAYDRQLAQRDPGPPAHGLPVPVPPPAAAVAAPMAAKQPRRDACKACYAGGVAAVILFHALLEAQSPQSWDDLIAIGWLSVFSALAVGALAWTLKRFGLHGEPRASADEPQRA